MASGYRSSELRLPPGWPERARAAIIHALSLTRVGLTALTDRVGNAQPVAERRRSYRLEPRSVTLLFARLGPTGTVGVP